MSTDIERELRDLFRDKAGEAPVVAPVAPQPVLRRGRRRQVGTVVASAAVTLLLIVGSVAGLRSILGGPEPFQTGPPGYDVFQRTATIEAFTVTSPSDWFLVNEWPLSMQIAVGSGSGSGECTAAPGEEPVCTNTEETTQQLEAPPYGLPMLQLSNVDTGLTALACGEDLPANAAVLYVALDYDRAIAGVADPSIRPFPPGIGLPPEGAGLCGPGRYAHFTVNGEPFISWIGLGSGVSDGDREIVERAYEMMSADDAWEPVQPDEATPAYVIGGGVTASGDVWRLELRRSAENVKLSLPGLESGVEDVAFPDEPLVWCCGHDDGLSVVTFGAVSKAATGVELRVADGGPVLAGTIVPLPPTMPFDFDLFFIEGTEGLGGNVVALGLDGDVPVSPPQVAGSRGDDVDLSGTLLGTGWDARFTGAFADGTACIRVTIGGGAKEPLCPKRLESSLAGDQPSLHGWLTSDLYLLAGSVSPDVVEIRFTSDDGTTPPAQFRCQMGPLGWTDPDRKVCAIALPPEGSGTLEYLDPGGNLLSQEGIAWGAAQPRSNAYPWTNEGGTVTATGSFQGADWKLEVLSYLDGYRLTIDGREVFEGRPFGLGEARAFPLFEGERAAYDALVLVQTTTDETSVAIAAEGAWEGRWLPGSTVGGGEGRLWVIEIPGAGTGSLIFDGDSYQGEVSWP